MKYRPYMVLRCSGCVNAITEIVVREADTIACERSWTEGADISVGGGERAYVDGGKGEKGVLSLFYFRAVVVWQERNVKCG